MTDKHKLSAAVVFLGLMAGNAWAYVMGIELRGNVVAYTCRVETGDDNKTVQLGRWPTRMLKAQGSTTQSMPFTLKLNGCPPAGSASITFSGKKASGNPELLALKDTSSATNVAVELLGVDKTRQPLEVASKDVAVDANGDATLTFFARYIAIADNPQAGGADAEATFVLNYN